MSLYKNIDIHIKISFSMNLSEEPDEKHFFYFKRDLICTQQFSPYATIGDLKCCSIQLYNTLIVVYYKKLLSTNH